MNSTQKDTAVKMLTKAGFVIAIAFEHPTDPGCWSVWGCLEKPKGGMLSFAFFTTESKEDTFHVALMGVDKEDRGIREFNSFYDAVNHLTGYAEKYG